jgi:hypothetical protein
MSHQYFKRQPGEWDIIEFLNEYDEVSLRRKLDVYLKSLEAIAGNKESERQKKAQLLIDNYKGVRENGQWHEPDSFMSCKTDS